MATPPAEALLDIARSGRIGRPVFVRWTATFAGVESAPDAIDEGLAVAEALFGAAPSTMTRLGDGEADALSALCRWQGGETALLAAGPAGIRREPRYDVTLIGSEGAAYFTDARTAQDA